MSELYRVRIKYHDGHIEVVDVSFSQLCRFLPPRHRNEVERLQQKNFFEGISSLDGPLGNAKLVKVL
ncbi:MAG: hypothetical protein Unbinned200contig1000_3 [Prokaryotic dsDNA virus sp.]|jgi:hypothetical protein|nr:MAG: hypothetical protein Unbinned200contig1000_3 [Prokaryotic dsDNA virus sp.]|tara:strand:+ start:13483 stop:13683 length:201 start_codon:yes stop_codon:yes gene_type:complete